MLHDEDWPVEELGSPEHKALTRPVMRCLKEVTTYTRRVMEKELFLRPTATFEDLHTFSRESTDTSHADRFNRESLSESHVLNFLAYEHENENNCHLMFQAVSNHLSTVDVRMAKTFEE